MKPRHTVILLLLTSCCTLIHSQQEGVGKIETSSRTPLVQSDTPSQPPPPVTSSLPLPSLIRILMAKHGESKTAQAFASLDSRPLGEVLRILLVKVDKDIANDIVAMQQHAQKYDKMLVALIARIVTGDQGVAKDIFEWDEKLRKYPWWARIRERMFVNLEGFVGSYDASQQKKNGDDGSGGSSEGGGGGVVGQNV